MHQIPELKNLHFLASIVKFKYHKNFFIYFDLFIFLKQKVTYDFIQQFCLFQEDSMIILISGGKKWIPLIIVTI